MFKTHCIKSAFYCSLQEAIVLKRQTFLQLANRARKGQSERLNCHISLSEWIMAMWLRVTIKNDSVFSFQTPPHPPCPQM